MYKLKINLVFFLCYCLVLLSFISTIYIGLFCLRSKVNLNYVFFVFLMINYYVSTSNQSCFILFVFVMVCRTLPSL